MLYPDRFIDAQFGKYDQVVRELKDGHKVSCWMWFIFPQLRGLGKSSTSIKYAIDNIDDAYSYLKHPLLGPRLIECTELTLAHDDKTPYDIFSSPDDLKFYSSMTLFSRVENTNNIFIQALNIYYNGTPDLLTIDLLKSE